MTTKKPYILILISFVILVVAVFCWQFFAAPGFQEKVRLVRSENAALVKDIAEIEAMDSNLNTLDKYISDVENYMSNKYASRAVTAQEAPVLIERICGDLGFKADKIALGSETLLFPAGNIAPALYSADITFLVEGTEETGTYVVNGLESYSSADFEVTSFVYRSFPPEKSEMEYRSEWIFSVTFYYYN